MVARWILVVVCLSGCDQLFGLVHVDDQPDASAVCPASYDITFAESTTHFQDALNDILAGGQKMF